jgi:hypothetical protein
VGRMPRFHPVKNSHSARIARPTGPAPRWHALCRVTPELRNNILLCDDAITVPGWAAQAGSKYGLRSRREACPPTVWL